MPLTMQPDTQNPFFFSVEAVVAGPTDLIFEELLRLAESVVPAGSVL
ncbi:hypothetical protein [Arthrobacter sp. A5]